MTLPYTRVLVTGATGFVGSQLCRALLTATVEVHAIGLPGSEPVVEGVRFHAGDITDAPWVQAVVEEVKPEVVFHLAAYGTFSHEYDVERMMAVNIAGTRNIVEASVSVGCPTFIQTGSIKEYATGSALIAETTLPAPWDNYAATKAAAHFFCRLAAARHGMRVTVVRLSPVYGPGDTLTRFVFAAIRAALTGEPFTISVGPLMRNFTYIDDVVDAFLSAATRGKGEVYEEVNLGSDAPASFDDILVAIEEVTGKSINKVVAPYPLGTNDSWLVDISKAKRLLEWQPKVSLVEGMRRAVEWYRQEV